MKSFAFINFVYACINGIFFVVGALGGIIAIATIADTALELHFSMGLTSFFVGLVTAVGSVIAIRFSNYTKAVLKRTLAKNKS